MIYVKQKKANSLYIKLNLSYPAAENAPIVSIHSHLSLPLFFRSMKSGLSLLLAVFTGNFSEANMLITQLTMLIRNEPIMAVQNPLTLKPGISSEVIISIKAFITNVKRPILIIFTGRVKISAMGLKKTFRIPRTAAARKADGMPSTLIPSIR